MFITGSFNKYLNSLFILKLHDPVTVHVSCHVRLLFSRSQQFNRWAQCYYYHYWWLRLQENSNMKLCYLLPHTDTLTFSRDYPLLSRSDTSSGWGDSSHRDANLRQDLKRASLTHKPKNVKAFQKYSTAFPLTPSIACVKWVISLRAKIKRLVSLPYHSTLRQFYNNSSIMIHLYTSYFTPAE